LGCSNSSKKDSSISFDQATSGNSNHNEKSEWPKHYAQKDPDFPGYWAELFLEEDSSFKFEDRRDESCWVWYTTFGKWLQKNDTIILSPYREGNMTIKLQDRKFIVQNDSLIFTKAKEQNPDINWWNFKKVQ
jgi:hypothetical protein